MSPFLSVLPRGHVLAEERPEDGRAIDTLLDRAFGADRHAKRSYAYRRGIACVADLARVARDPAGRVVGTIRYWPITIAGAAGSGPALLLGPVAVEPELKGIGIGRALIAETLDRARLAGHALVLLVGDPGYYGPLGFQPAAPLGFAMPGEAPQRLQLRALRPGAEHDSGLVLRADGAPPP